MEDEKGGVGEGREEEEEERWRRRKERRRSRETTAPPIRYILHSFATQASASVQVPGIDSAYASKYWVPYGELKHSYGEVIDYLGLRSGHHMQTPFE